MTLARRSLAWALLFALVASVTALTPPGGVPEPCRISLDGEPRR